MGKIISFGRFPKQKDLTPQMIRTLRQACEKQKKHEPLGQADLDGSFTSLLKRELIDVKTETHDGVKQRIWFVTQSGIEALKRLGYYK